MRKLILAAALLSVVGVPAGAETITLYSQASADHFVEFGREGGIGDLILWNSALEDEAGTRVGSDSGRCTRIDPEGNYLCTNVIDHEGHGRIAFTGVQHPPPQTSTLVVTGGTAAYLGAAGTLSSTPVEDRARFRYVIELRERP